MKRHLAELVHAALAGLPNLVHELHDAFVVAAADLPARLVDHVPASLDGAQLAVHALDAVLGQVAEAAQVALEEHQGAPRARLQRCGRGRGRQQRQQPAQVLRHGRDVVLDHLLQRQRRRRRRVYDGAGHGSAAGGHWGGGCVPLGRGGRVACDARRGVVAMWMLMGR